MGRSLAAGASTEDQHLDKTVAFVPPGLTCALEKQKYRQRSDEVKPISPKNLVENC